MSSDKYILEKIESALGILDKALSEVVTSSDEEYSIGKLGRAIGMLREFQSPIYERNPSLRPLPPWHDVEEPRLTEEQADAVSKISASELRGIDKELLSLVNDRSQKVEKIVLSYMSKNENVAPEVPDLFYAQRIERMALEGKVEYAGNLKFRQYCEVKIAKT